MPKENSQNMPEIAVEMKRQHMRGQADRELPGESLIAEGAGEVPEGSARKYAKAMDRITGSSMESEAKTMKRSRPLD